MELKPSIIAKLMGLDDIPSQRDVPKRGKVLSEKYFQKVAFIGVRERSRSPDRCSSVMRSPKRSDEYSNFFSGMEKDKMDRNLGEGEKANSNFVEICSAPANFKVSEIVLLKTWRGREENQKLGEFSSRCSSRKSRNERQQNVWRDYCRESEAVGQRLREEVDEISRQMKFNSFPNLNFGKNNSSSLHTISERWKMVKDFQDLRRQSSSRGGCWTLGEMLSMHDHGLSCPFLNQSPCEFVKTNRYTNLRRHPRIRMTDNRTRHSNTSQVSKEVGLTKESAVVTEDDFLHQGRALSGSKIYSQRSHSAVVEIEVSNKMQLPSKNDLPIRNTSVIHKELKKKKKKKQQQQQRIWDLSWAKTAAPDLTINLHTSTTNPTENTTKQDELIVIPEEAFVSSDCCSDTESCKSVKEASQFSPYLVLEPFEDSPPSSSLSDDLSDMQFHPFSVLAPSRASSKQKEKSDRVGKNQEFRYLSNLLTQAGFHGLTLIQGFGKWHSIECPINPLVFETLEKEYAKEKSWRRSESKLLFDRINLGLYEICHQYTGFFSLPKPVSTMMSSKLWYEVTEELLWNLLVRQKQEARKKSSTTVVEDDFELMDFGEYVDFIAGELENLLVDELAAEFLSW